MKRPRRSKRRSSRHPSFTRPNIRRRLSISMMTLPSRKKRMRRMMPKAKSPEAGGQANSRRLSPIRKSPSPILPLSGEERPESSR